MEDYKNNGDLKPGDKIYYYKYSGFRNNVDSWIGEAEIEKVKINGRVVEIRVADWKKKFFSSPFLYGHKDDDYLSGRGICCSPNREQVKDYSLLRDIQDKYCDFKTALKKLNDLGFNVSLTTKQE